jgi:hypothetical protein
VPEGDDLRAFIREITLRFERGMQSIASEIRDETRLIRDEIGVHRAESREYFERLRAEDERESRRIDELIEESRAQRQALLHVLDRLDNGGAAPAA